MTLVDSPDPFAPAPENSLHASEDDAARVARMPSVPDDARTVEDAYAGVRVEHSLPPEGPAPAEQTVGAGRPAKAVAKDGPPVEDVKIMPDGPSVWEATGRPVE